MHLVRGGARAGNQPTAGHSEPLLLASSPLPITIGPDQAVAHPAWRTARERVLAAALAGPSLVLVLGSPGTGKTLLLHEIARALRAGGADVLLHLRGDLPVDATAGKVVEGRPAEGEALRRVVLIDEADRLNEAMLERLGRLGECTIVLAGTADPGDDACDPSATTVVRLSALPPDEVGPFLAARLAQAGLDPELLSGAAVARLAERSGGVPRVLNILAGASLFLARAEGAPRVEAEHVDKAAALRDGDLGIGAAEAPEPVAPGSAPRQEAAPETLPPASSAAAPMDSAAAPMDDAPGASVAAPPPRLAPRRRTMAVLGATAGIAAACAWIVLGHGERAPQPTPVMAEASVPLAAPHKVPEREQQTAAAVLPASRAVPGTPAAPALPPAAPGPPSPASAALDSRVAAASPPVAATPVAPPSARDEVAESAPSEPQALPSGAFPRVLLRYARGSAEAASQAASLAATLRTAGFAVDGLAAVQHRDDKPGARYFFAEDRDAAASVLRAAGLPGRGTLADAAKLEAPPRPGTVELVVPPTLVEIGGRRDPFGPGRS